MNDSIHKTPKAVPKSMFTLKAERPLFLQFHKQFETFDNYHKTVNALKNYNIVVIKSQ